MKTKKVLIRKNKLIELQILKVYYKKKSLNFKNNLKQIKIHLNKISKIIYKYHINNKKILFIGFPNNFNKILKNTKHNLIPEFVWFNGILNNRINKKDNIPLNIYKLITTLKKKIDLVVIANLNEKTTAIEESYVARIPVITIKKKQNIFNNKTTYDSIGNYNLINEKMEINNLFFSFIKTTLNRTKKVKVYNDLKISKENYKKTQHRKKHFKSLKKNNINYKK